MPQVFQVLKCYKCLVFQIHQTKKSNKFECKMCGEKQSIKRHYGIGTGKDCRLHVQRLNSLRGEMEATSSTQSSDDELEDHNTDDNTSDNTEKSYANSTKRSRWSTFVDKNEEETEQCAEESMFFEDKEVVLEAPQKKRTRKFKVKPKSSCNIEDELNTVNDSSSVKLKSNFTVSKTDNFESKDNLKPIMDYSQNNINKVIAYREPASDKHCISMNQKSPEKLQIISTNSKWAQFVASDEEIENIPEDTLSDIEHAKNYNKVDNLFSLCDDNDLDNVLDI